MAVLPDDRRDNGAAAQESAPQRRHRAPSAKGPPPIAPFARGALLTIDAAEAALTAWRDWADAAHAITRRQQQFALDMARAQLAALAGSPDDSQDIQAGGREALFAPMLAAAKSYERVSGAVLQAQREAFDALARQPFMH